MSVFRRRMRLRLAAGSATLPSLGVGEGGNGLYQPAAGTVAFAAGVKNEHRRPEPHPEFQEAF